MANVYIFLTEGFEEIEGLTVVDVLRRTEIDITTVSLTGNIQVTGSHQITVLADKLFEEVSFEDADMLVLPGGPGTGKLLEHEGLDRLLKEHHAKGGRLAAICAAPRVFGLKGFLQGKKATCFPGFEKDLLGAQAMGTAVVTDGNITTSKGMGTAIDFSLSLVEALKGKEEAVRISKAIQYTS